MVTAATLYQIGTEGDDSLVGSNFDFNVLIGLGGDDTLGVLNGGDNLLDGGDGNDLIIGGIGADIMLGGNGNDTLIGGSGSDSLWGDDGDDILRGQNGSVLDGGAGDDVLSFILTGIGAPVGTGGAGADTFVLEWGGLYAVHHMITDLTITDFDPSEDTIDFGLGKSDFAPTAIISVVETGTGTLVGFDTGSTVTFEGLSLWDTLHLTGADVGGVAQGTEGDDRLLFVDGPINGGAGNDLIRTNAGDDVIFGGSGDDTIQGFRGNDSIDGGSGDDLIYGCVGNNVLLGGEGQDTIHSGNHSSLLDGGEGDDLLVLRMISGGDHTATGGAGADTFDFKDFTNKQGDVTITDFEVGVDSLLIESVAFDAYLQGAPTTTLFDTDAGLLITLAEGDTILLQDLTLAEFNGTLLPASNDFMTS
ncbi:hemolysin type calcium-binding protein [Rhodobacter sp. JA431]|uniref:calcium-binding protein n=1 Tax=Rhodobacter sp. JA431 TaxID=570013 RepID=UPI000BCECD10|nr:calcium-binding protein [Rhodobacter sp. JA431]SOC13146.1 hemolysin type calcium-binding protein [Rhodobacter sp. JA431]